MKDEEREDLIKSAEAAVRMRHFLKSKEWLTDLQPQIAREQQAADVKRSYHPSVKGLDEPESYRAYYSGIFDLSENILKMIHLIIENGDEAQKELDREREAAK